MFKMAQSLRLCSSVLPLSLSRSCASLGAYHFIFDGDRLGDFRKIAGCCGLILREESLARKYLGEKIPTLSNTKILQRSFHTNTLTLVLYLLYTFYLKIKTYDCRRLKELCYDVQHHFRFLNSEWNQRKPENNCRVGAVVRALAFHQCDPGSIPGLDAICGLSFLVLYSAPRGFSPGTPVFPSHQKPTLIRLD